MPERPSEAAHRKSIRKSVPPRCGSVCWLAACGLLAAALFGFTHTAEAEPDPYAPKWNPWAELGGYWGSGDRSRGVGELWAPLMQGPASLLFFDGRFQLFEEDVREGNAALGLRKMTPSGWNLGAWVSGDVRETGADNTFWQVAGGLEALSVTWDLRLNGYVPTTDPQLSPSTAEIVLTRNNIFLIGGEEVALYGFDGEVGYLLLGSPQTKQGTRHELRVYGGGFWFDHSDAIHEVAGPKARIEWRIDDVIANWAGSRLTFETEYSHDEVRDDLWQVGLRLRVPFGGTEKAYASLTPQERRMTERIYRDDDIVTVQSGPEEVRDALTGVLFERVAYVNPSITEVSAQAGDNSLLIVNGTVSGPQELQGNQTLQGGKSTIQVTGVKSGVTTNFTAPGATAHLNDPGDAPNLTLLGSNTHVAGLEIQGTPGFAGNPAGISGPGPLNNVVIQQTSVANTGFASAGIAFGGNNRNIRIFDTTVTGAGFLGGIFFGIDNRDIAISDVTVTDTTGTGIFLGVDARHVSISDSTITGITVASGIGVGNGSSDVNISNVTIADIGSFGIIAGSNNSNVRISNSTIANTGGDGIQFIDDNSNVTIENVMIANAGVVPNPDRNGIQFGSGNSNVTIANTMIEDAAGNGIFFFDGNSNVTIAGTTISGAGANGILIGANNTIALDNSTLAGTFGADGILIDGTGNDLNGDGNTAANATFPAGDLCQDNGNAWAGTVVFDGVPITDATCP